MAAMVLYARGKQQDAFALAFTAGAVSTVLAAARALAEDSPGLPHAGSPQPQAPTAMAGLGASFLGPRWR